MTERIFQFAVVLCVLFLAISSNAQSNCAEKDHDCRIKLLTNTIQTDPRNIEAYYDLGLAFQRAGRYKEAVEIYSMYISAPVQNRTHLADGHNNRAVSLRKLGLHEKALEDLNKAIEFTPKNASFLTNRGNTYRDLRKFDLALKDYDSALSLDPVYAPAFIGRGLLHDVKGNSARAIADFTSAIKLAPDEPEAYYNRAGVRFARREYAKAIPDYDKYIKLNPPNTAFLADGYINRAISRFYTGSSEAAIRDLTKAIKLRPTDSRAYKARAYVYRELKKPDLADADEKKAAEL